MGGNTYYRFVRARSLSLGKQSEMSVAGPVIGLSVGGTLKSSWHEGLLGTEYLDHFKIAFDYSRSLLLLASDGPLVAAPFDRSGLFIVWRGQRARSGYLVRDVLHNGPGDAAGVQVGDELLAVDGRPASGMPLADIRAHLRSKAATLNLKIRRAGRSMELTVHLRDLA